MRSICDWKESISYARMVRSFTSFYSHSYIPFRLSHSFIVSQSREEGLIFSNGAIVPYDNERGVCSSGDAHVDSLFGQSLPRMMQFLVKPMREMEMDRIEYILLMMVMIFAESQLLFNP